VPGSEFETLASGYGLVEGPTVAPDGGLYFSDVLRGGVHHLAPDGSISMVVPKRRGVGGIALHADGGLVLSGRDIVHVQSGETRTLFSIPGLPGWNDLCTDDAGRVYAGALRFPVFDPNADVLPGECWRIDGEGNAHRLYAGVVHPNGIGVSPDGRTLWHSDTRSRRLVVHDLVGDGVARRREFPVDGHPDGLAFDEAGCCWVAVAGGGRLERFTPAGEVDTRLEVPASMVTSVCFAGEDLAEIIAVSADHSLQPDCHGSIFRARAPVRGAPVHPARA
jgi:D-xylonolactonase